MQSFLGDCVCANKRLESRVRILPSKNLGMTEKRGIAFGALEGKTER